MSEILPQLSEEDVDRVREVTSIGAAHAANALAALVGATCEMRVPQVRLLPPERLSAPFVVDPTDGDGRDAIGALTSKYIARHSRNHQNIFY